MIRAKTKPKDLYATLQLLITMVGTKELKPIFGMEFWHSLETCITSVRRHLGSELENGPLTLRVEGPHEYSNFTLIPTPQIDELVGAYEGVANTDGLVGKRVIAYYNATQLRGVQPLLSSD